MQRKKFMKNRASCWSCTVHRVGSLYEYMAHECAKSSLAFPKPAVAAASRRPARPRADGPKVGLEMALQASALGELRGALGRLGYLCARGAKAIFVAAADHSMLPGPR